MPFTLMLFSLMTIRQISEEMPLDIHHLIKLPSEHMQVEHKSLECNKNIIEYTWQ